MRTSRVKLLLLFSFSFCAALPLSSSRGVSFSAIFGRPIGRSRKINPRHSFRQHCCCCCCCCRCCCCHSLLFLFVHIENLSINLISRTTSVLLPTNTRLAMSQVSRCATGWSSAQGRRLNSNTCTFWRISYEERPVDLVMRVRTNPGVGYSRFARPFLASEGVLEGVPSPGGERRKLPQPPFFCFLDAFS